ncbi:MAG: hypothetical protein ACO307_06470 [Ilumatobacteraceae bacterium]
MTPRPLHRALAAASVLVLSSTLGCVGSEVAAPRPPAQGGTVPLGALPGQPSSMTLPSLPAAPTTTVEPVVEPTVDAVSAPLVDDVTGTAVLLIGDTALAETTARATGSMCEVVTDSGWDVQVEAERGRPVEFGGTVLDALLDSAPASGDDWAVVGVMFGHHLSDAMGDALDDSVPDRFGEALAMLVDRLGNRPVIVFTIVEIDPEQSGINDSIRAVAGERPNVVVVDWAASVVDDPTLVVEGGPVPSDAGASTLAELTADVLGEVVDADRGACLESSFVDDSAIVL